MEIQIVRSGVVVDTILIPDGATVAPDGASVSWPGGSYDAPSGSTMTSQAGAIGWTLSGDVLSAPTVARQTQAELRAALMTEASSAAAFIVSQVMPDAAHQAAFQNAASIVNGSGGAAPSSGPLASKFTALSSTYGMSANAFATLVLAMQGASFDLSAALVTLSSASASAASAADLASALATFETAIAAVASEVNAASPPVAIVSPAAIVIAGVNA